MCSLLRVSMFRSPRTPVIVDNWDVYSARSELIMSIGQVLESIVPSNKRLCVKRSTSTGDHPDINSSNMKRYITQDMLSRSSMALLDYRTNEPLSRLRLFMFCLWIVATWEKQQFVHAVEIERVKLVAMISQLREYWASLCLGMNKELHKTIDEECYKFAQTKPLISQLETRMCTTIEATVKKRENFDFIQRVDEVSYSPRTLLGPSIQCSFYSC